MKLIAKKPCSFGGKKFYIGDEIPAELVVSPADQEKMGVLAQVNEQGHPAPEPEATPVVSTITVNVHVQEGDMPLELTSEGLQSVFDVLMAKAPEAVPIIEKMTDSDALILLHITDARKTIKELAEARAKALNEVPDDGQEGAESEGEQ